MSCVEENSVGAITEATCWAHSRPKFYEVTIANDKANIAISLLEEILEIYQIEGEVKCLEPEKRLENRQQESKELVEKLFNNFRKHRKELSLKSATAIAYALNNEVALRRFIDDDKSEIDNNAAERAVKTIAVGRKNWLFTGSDNGGHTVAGVYSLIESQNEQYQLTAIFAESAGNYTGLQLQEDCRPAPLEYYTIFKFS